MTDEQIVVAVIVALVAGGVLLYSVGYLFSRGYHAAKRQFMRKLVNDSIERGSKR